MKLLLMVHLFSMWCRGQETKSDVNASIDKIENGIKYAVEVHKKPLIQDQIHL